MIRHVAAATLALLLLCLLITAQRIRPNALPPTSVVRDSFTGPDGTALETHPSDNGYPYFRPPYANNGTIYLSGNQARHGAIPYRSLYLAGTQIQADVYIKAKITINDDATPMLVLRANAETENYLGASYNVNDKAWTVFLNMGYEGKTPLVTVLGTWPESITPGQSRAVKFQAVNDNITLTIDGVTRIEAEKYDSLVGPGYAGIGLAEASGAVGTSIDDLDIGNVVEIYPSPDPTPDPTPCQAWHLTTDTATRKVWDCY